MAKDWRNELLRIAEDNGGILLPDTVVRHAMNPKSALHDKFEWDDTVAAYQHRLTQARALIVDVEIVIPNRSEPVQAFVSLSVDRSGRGGYRLINDVISNEQYCAILLDDARRDMEVFVKKYQHLKQLSGIIRVMKKFTAKLSAKT